jgi:hypothetical protein
MEMTKEEAEILANQAIDHLSADVLQEDMSDAEINKRGVALCSRIIKLLEFIRS